LLDLTNYRTLPPAARPAIQERPLEKHLATTMPASHPTKIRQFSSKTGGVSGKPENFFYPGGKKLQGNTLQTKPSQRQTRFSLP
jgi:hypothetical protein